MSNLKKPKSKQQLVDEIAAVAQLQGRFKLGVGSSIPSSFFDSLQNKFHTPRTKGMENIAAVICVENGFDWDETCDSSMSPSGGGGTVTKKGLEQLLLAVKKAVAVDTGADN